AIARLAPGVSREQALSEASRILEGIRQQFPAESGHLGVILVPLRDRLAGEYAPALVRLLGAVLLLLAVTCTTAMNLPLGPRVGRLRQGLVALQLALSVVLLVGAGLMVRSQVNLGRVDLGFRAEDTLSFRLVLPQPRYPEPRQRAAFFASLMDELRSAPGV